MYSWHKIFEFFTGDRALMFLLTSITVLIFFIYPLSGNDIFSSLIANLFIIIMLLSGIMSIDIKQVNKKRIIYMILVILILGKTGEIFETVYIAAIHITARILFLCILVVLVFKKVFRNKPITFFYRIAGSVTIYLLISFIWANLYFIFYQLNNDSFHFNPPIRTQDNQMSNFIYFSLETITTLGLGDILPIHPFLKSLVTMEAVIGPLYLAVTIGRLVSKQGSVFSKGS